MKRKITGLFLLLLIAGGSFGQQPPFALVNVSLPQLGYGNCAWADYDRDGDPDMVLMGSTGADPVTLVMRNDNGTFTDIQAGLPGLQYGSAEWGDFDNDGDLDLLLCGADVSGTSTTRIMSNNNGTFTDPGILLPGVQDGRAVWGDFDNDEDLDILLAGSGIAAIYRNDGNNLFTDIGANLPQVQNARCCWGDYNNDGQADALVTGDTGGGMFTRLFRNYHGSFEEVEVTPEPLYGLYGGDAEFADLDSDGDLDLVVSGMDIYVDGYVLVYRNDGDDHFTRFDLPNANVLHSSFDLGDYDADGLQDIIMISRQPACGGTAFTMLYQNLGFLNFFPVASQLPDIRNGGVTWGDYNGDGYTDLLFTGLDGYGVNKTLLYRNTLGNAGFAMNTAPSSPSGLNAVQQGNDMVLAWNPATDAETARAALSYNIMIGTQPGLGDICSPMADPVTGFRRVVKPGNTTADTAWKITGIPYGTYYFSVQTIDNGFVSSEFSQAMSFLYSPVGIPHPGKENQQISLFPNPCSDHITIFDASLVDSPDKICPATVTYIVSNYLGQAIIQGTGNTIDTSKLPGGIYLFTLFTPQGPVSKSFIKE